MRICRIALDGEHPYGVIEGDAVALITGVPWGAFEPDGRVLKLSDVRLTAPVLPSKIVAVAKNYLDHVREMGGEAPPAEPMIFLKPSTSVIGPGDPIVLPWQSEQVEHEAELAVVMGVWCRDVSVDDALDYVAGYTCANDVTARDLQRTDGQWGRAKGFDTFCPLGPVLVTRDEIPNPNALRIRTILNGETMQDSNTKQLIFRLDEVIAYMSQIFTLEPGDLIFTGTPSGVGMARKPPRFLQPGNVLETWIEGIGRLRNRITAGAAS